MNRNHWFSEARPLMAVVPLQPSNLSIHRFGAPSSTAKTSGSSRQDNRSVTALASTQQAAPRPPE